MSSRFPTSGAWDGRRVLVTGNTGFKGSWLSYWLHALGAEVLGLSLPDPPTDPSLWADLGLPTRQISSDVRGLEWATDVREFDPEVLFHLAAQPIVAQGYADPVGTFAANVVGVGNILEATESLPSLGATVVITTDKVYDPRQSGPHLEQAFLGGKDPYSASKAGAELVCGSWPNRARPLATARAGNVVGGGDWAQDRLVPDMVRAWSSGRSVVLRDPNGVRPWQHVLEPLRGYLLLAEGLLAGRPMPRALNFGPAREDMVAVGDLVDHCAKSWAADGREMNWSASATRTYEETGVLTLDSELAADAVGWRGLMGWQKTMRMTLDWYRDYLSGAPSLELVKRDLAHYYELGQGAAGPPGLGNRNE